MIDRQALVAALSAVDARTFAESAGLEVLRRTPKRWTVRCLAPENHAHGDRNASAWVGPTGWGCYACEAGGGIVDLAARLTGRDPKRDFPELYRWITGEPLPGHGDRPPAILTAVRREAAAPVTSASPELAAACARAWAACRPVAADDLVAGYVLAECGAEPDAVDATMARALTREAAAEIDELGEWYARDDRMARGWLASDRRLVLATRNDLGDVVGIRGRLIRPARQWIDADGKECVEAKERGPSGLGATGVYTDTAIKRALAGERDWPRVVVVVEGGTDSLVASTRADYDDGSGVGVIGIYSGAWSEALAARIPTSTVVLVGTDMDPAGHRYAARVRETLPDHRVRRIATPERIDWRALARREGATMAMSLADDVAWVRA